MAGPDISRLSKDLVLKRVVETFGDVFSERFNLPFGQISSALPAAMPALEIRGWDTDLLFRLGNGEILHIEFQTVYVEADIWRFSDYNHAVAYRYHARTHTVIIYGPRVVNAPDRLDLGSHIFTMHTRFLRREQGARSLRPLQAKVARGEVLDALDRLDLLLAPLTEIAPSAIANLSREAGEIAKSLPSEERLQTIGAMVGLAYHTIDKDVSRALLEGLTMANAARELIDNAIGEGYQKGEAQGLSQGLSQGRTETERQAVLRVRALRFGTMPTVAEQRLSTIDDFDRLEALLDLAITALTADDFLLAL